MRLHYAIGLGGVHRDETVYARYWSRALTLMMGGLIIALLYYWSIRPRGPMLHSSEIIFNLIVWGLFVIDVVVTPFLLKEKRRYFKQNWLKLVIVMLGIPPFLGYTHALVLYRFLDPLLALLLLSSWSDFALRSLSDNRLLTTLVTFLCVVIVGGFLIAGLDPAFSSPWDGFWWAWVTMSTVGYGDYVPVTGLGRLFAAFLIFLGLGFFSVITANFAALFLQKDVSHIEKENRAILHALEGLSSIGEQMDMLVIRLNSLEKRFHALEERLRVQQQEH